MNQKYHVIVLTSRQHRTITIEVRAGRISSVDNQSGINFPWVTGQPFSRSIETWCQTHNFLYDGVDLERKNRKIMGVPIKHVPEGHILRTIYPNKFR